MNAPFAVAATRAVLLFGIWPKPLTDLMEPSLAQLATQIASSKL